MFKLKITGTQTSFEPTPSMSDDLAFRRSDFATLSEALDYAARGQTGVNFYSALGALDAVYGYSDIQIRAKAIAQSLLAMGLCRGDRVGLVAEMSFDFICSFFACQYAGLLAVPLPVVTGLGGRQGYEAQLRRVIETSGARLALGAQSAVADLEIAADGLDLLYVGAWDDLPDAAGHVDLQPLGPDEPSHIQYSSGSTRNPHGVIISQKAMMANAKAVAEYGLKFVPGDRCASWLPFYHDMGLIGFLLIPLTSQLSIDYIHTDSFARRPLLWLDIIAKNRVSLAYSPSFGYEICTRRAKKKDGLDLDLSHWRAAGIGGEMVQPEVMVEFDDVFAQYGFDEKAFVPSYGLAEMTLAFSFAPLGTGVAVDEISKTAMVEQSLAIPAKGDEQTRKLARCGFPLPGHGVEIRGEDGACLPECEIGAVYMNGPSLMGGYFQDDAATSAAIDSQNWLHTGDMGYMRGGELVITGRQKDLIIINGRNIWPQDMEWHAEDEIESLRARDTAAFCVENEQGKDQAVILVHCRHQQRENQDALRQNVHASIFRNTGVDCKVVLIPPSSLPFTTSGKLSRARAKAGFLAGDLQDIVT